MKVLLVNGSPHKEGCTYTALNVASLLKCLEAGAKNGVALPEKEARVFTNFIH